MAQAWRLDGHGQTLVLRSEGDRLPAIIYFGAVLPAGEDLGMLATSTLSDIGGGMLDAQVPVSICPEPDTGFPGQPGLRIADGEGNPLSVQFREVSVDLTDDALQVRAKDPDLGIAYEADFTFAPSGLLEASASIRSDEAIRVHWLAAPVFPGPPDADRFQTITGRWLSEFQVNEVAWTPGLHLQEPPNGRSGHESFPGALFPACGSNSVRGPVTAFHYGWSGGHRMAAEQLTDGRRQIQFGHAAASERQAGTEFQTAKLYAVHSEAGTNGAAARFQAHVCDHLVPWPDRDRPRPVHYNCWEAVYFDHDLSTLSDIARRAADLGVERFVLDDGWFGRRDDDTSSLGDWTVDPRKWPDGLGPLIDAVTDLGMRFGIWVEPEMVNPDSDLFRAHPDWILGHADQVLGRGQYVLDMARPEVRDYLFDAIDAVLAAHPVDYVKWDHNRLLPISDAAQTRGFYDLLDRLRVAHPTVEFESCASGGGRIDFGVLARAHRVWLSDSNDAFERLRIQHDAALFLPACVTGAHVGAHKSHSSGREVPMPFRAWVAAQRHMGLEMDLRDLTDAESETLREVIGWWKANRDWMMRATIHRLDVADPAVTAEVQVAEDGKRFVLFAAHAETSAQSLPLPLQITGLDANTRYRLRLVNPSDASPHSRGPVALRDGELTLSGAALASTGLRLPLGWPGTIWVVEGEVAGD